MLNFEMLKKYLYLLNPFNFPILKLYKIKMFHFTLFLVFFLYKKLKLRSLNKKLNVFRNAAPLPLVRRHPTKGCF